MEMGGGESICEHSSGKIRMKLTGVWIFPRKTPTAPGKRSRQIGGSIQSPWSYCFWLGCTYLNTSLKSTKQEAQKRPLQPFDWRDSSHRIDYLDFCTPVWTLDFSIHTNTHIVYILHVLVHVCFTWILSFCSNIPTDSCYWVVGSISWKSSWLETDPTK